ncbi:MAG: hypothetical protein NTZ80_01290 [Patescibacteria group bacterium]|nr:hypothetical protein [Patescibacteria group bacterium]
MKVCSVCAKSFDVTAEDSAFYEKVSPVFNGQQFKIPEPTLCFDCRRTRRLSFRNVRSFYSRKCALCNKQMVSLYSPDKELPAYCQKCWWSDDWDALSYGQEFDFSRPFFEQFEELKQKVPHITLRAAAGENCEYTNFTSYNKNCYLTFGASYNEDCHYSYWVAYNKNVVDNFYLLHGESCYECVYCDSCHNGYYLEACRNCSESAFLYNCVNCDRCFLCSNLRNKQYCFQNKQYAPEEYKQKMHEFDLGAYSVVSDLKKQLADLKLHTVRSHLNILNSENCFGDYIIGSKDCFDVFYSENSRDIRRSRWIFNSRDTQDGESVVHNSEKTYECCSATHCFQALFGFDLLEVSDGYYCHHCFNNCSNLFGCISLRHKENCILNKQYSKAEYEVLVSKIIDHMQKTHEFGEFFPASCSGFGYNETMAQEEYPTDKKAVIDLGFHWNDYVPAKSQAENLILARDLPNNIKDVGDDILSFAIECEATKKPFRIIKQELDFYRQNHLPLARRHPDQRHLDRLGLQNPSKLWRRNCMKCGNEMNTSYAPERPEVVYCEKCYMESVYL